MKEVVIIGAGVAGAAAAYQLRDRDILLLESEEEVGGRTRSVRFDDAVWGNYGAQAVPADRVRNASFATEVGAYLRPEPKFKKYWNAHLPHDKDGLAEIDAIAQRLKFEMNDRRDPTVPSLDDQSFAEWLGVIGTEAAEYFESFTLCSTFSLSLYGAMMLWGEHRMTAWDEEVPLTKMGDAYVVGGTQQIVLGAVAAVGTDRVRTSSPVYLVDSIPGGYRVTVDGPFGRYTVDTERIVSAVPAPLAARIFASVLPAWKLDALDSVKYARWIATPVWIAGKDADGPRFDVGIYRPRVRYEATSFQFRSPTDFDTQGGVIGAFMVDDATAQVWEDSDDSIRSGVAARLLTRFPEFKGRIREVALQRWEHGLPLVRPGHMKQVPALARPVDGISFCGDYTGDMVFMEGSILSGERAAEEVRANRREK